MLCRIFSIFFTALLLNAAAQEGAVEEFCTATPVANFPTVAQCRPQSDNGVEYEVEVTPVIGRGYSNQCNVHLEIIGTAGETQPISIASSDNGIKRKQKVSRQDIGSPVQLKVTLRGSPETKWKCQRIIIRQDFKWWAFDCTGVLDSENETAVYQLSGNKIYTITVQTGGADLAGTHGAIELNLKGETRETGLKFLRQGFHPASQRVISYRGADVGNVEEIIIHNTAEDDPWYCTFIDVRGDDGKVAHFVVRRWIGIPYDKTISVLLNTQHVLDLPAQDIECFTRASDIISGLPNTLKVTKVRCPMNCDNNPFALVRGSSVHPSTSSVCQSAVLDGVLGSSGGELVLTAIGALPEYFEPPEILTHIRARDYEPSPDKPTFTYFVYQSYSIDNINKDVRVVDAYGKLSATGRLEVRREGTWGSVCSKGDLGDFNHAAARQACQEIGFIHGIYIESGCGFVKGTNVCAGKGYRTAVAAIQCTGNEKTVAECTFEEPPAMCSDHVFDVAVQCTNFPPDREPTAGTIRIVDANGAPAVLGIGRLEYYLDGWGTVCDDNFTFESEGVACREMGYSAIKSGGASSKGCIDAQGVNLCGPSKQKINVVDLACDGTEKNIRGCPHETRSDIYCVHDEDVVISCEGDGDPSGIGLFKKEEFPDVGIRPFAPMINLKCSDKPITTKPLRGSPGSMFIVRCPEGCDEDPTDIRGTFIYTDDSSVCRAALHVGAIDNSGGDFVIVLGYGQRGYTASLRTNIQSIEFGPYARSFMVSRLLPSVGARVVPEIKKNVYSHFAGESLLSKPPSFLQALEPDSSAIVEPLFSWCPNPSFPGFHQRPGDFVDASKLPGGTILSTTKDFSISVRAKVTGGSGTWRAILAHTECSGFTLVINKEDQVIFEQICNPKTVNSGYKPVLNEWFHVLVTFFEPDKTVGIFINGNRMAHEQTNYVFNFRAPMTIGRSSYLETEYFEGDIGCVRLFGYVLNPSQIEKEKIITEKPMDACPMSQSGQGAMRSRYTVDGRLCLTPCLSQAGDAGPSPAAVFTEKRPTHPAFRITCNETLTVEKFNGSTGEMFRVICPDGCCSETAPIYGDRIYAAKSSVCRAALHQGAVGNSGGEITVTLQNGLSFYDGVAGKNYIDSEIEQNPQSRSFTISRAQPVREMNCHSDASFIMKMPLSKRDVVQCPENCGKLDKVQVFGSMVYSPASSVCQAAIHSGVLTNFGGQVEISVQGDSNFLGSLQNGLQSNPADYYLRSFSFLHTTDISCTPFSFYTPSLSNEKSRRSDWEEYSPTKSVGQTKSFVIQSKDNMTLPIIFIKDFKCNDLPHLFVVNAFRCDRFVLQTNMTLTNAPSTAGVSFGVQDEHNFFTLTAVVKDTTGKGKWTVTKVMQGEQIKAGPDVPFQFTFNSTLSIKVISDGKKIQGWITHSQNQITHIQMVANIKDVSSKSNIGSVGLNVCLAPLSGISFTTFQVQPSQVSEDIYIPNNISSTIFTPNFVPATFYSSTDHEKLSSLFLPNRNTLSIIKQMIFK